MLEQGSEKCYNQAMEKEPKTFQELQKKTLLSKENPKDYLKKTASVDSWLELHRDRKKIARQKIFGSEIDAWFVYSGNDQDLQVKESFAKLENDCDAISRQRDEEIGYREGMENNERRFGFRKTSFQDLEDTLREAYSWNEDALEIPEVLIILGDKTKASTEILAKANSVVENFIEKMYSENSVVDGEVRSFLSKHKELISSSKMPISDESVVKLCVAKFDEVTTRAQRYGLYSKYYAAQSLESFAASFPEEVLKAMLEAVQFVEQREMDEMSDKLTDAFVASGDLRSQFWPEKLDEFAKSFRQQLDHTQEQEKWEKETEGSGEDWDYTPAASEGRAAAKAYVLYRKALAEHAKKMDFDKVKMDLAETWVQTLRACLDGSKERYVEIKEETDWERKILKPIIVAVSQDTQQRELMMENGANMVVSEMSKQKIEKLLKFVAHVKSNLASLSVERLRKTKQEFYQAVETKLEDRSEITAETEKEVAILEEIFQENGCKKILDIGCGAGRIDLPLLRSGYYLTGIEANESFLLTAMRRANEENLSNASFKKGDVIEYQKQITRGSQDAVIYTWHTILEAFGPGNLLTSLNSAWLALKSGGVLVFDQPTRENQHMEDGWYGNDPDGEHNYLAYLMDEDEIRFILEMAGFKDVEIKHWSTKPNEEYPEGMKKITVSAKKS